MQKKIPINVMHLSEELFEKRKLTKIVRYPLSFKELIKFENIVNRRVGIWWALSIIFPKVFF